MILSLCIIVKDEEEVIERCLNSIQLLVDEIIIVDTGSVDSTKELCKKFNAKIFDFTWCHDFAKARNYAFKQASGEYILWLDADDIIEEADFVKLQALKHRLLNDVYFLKYNYSQDHYGKSNCTFYRERIVKNTVGINWQYPVHEIIAYPPGSSSSFQDITITHKRTLKGYQNDQNRNLEILERSIVLPTFSDSPRMWYYLAREYQDKHLYQEAIASYHQFIGFTQHQTWIEDFVTAHFKIAKCYFEIYRTNNDTYAHFGEKTRAWARRAMMIDDRWAEPQFLLGEIALFEKQYEEAIFWFEKCIRPLPDVIGPIDYSVYGLMPNVQLMFCYDALKDYEKANHYNEKALEIAPGDVGLLHNQRYYAMLIESIQHKQETRIGWFGQQLDHSFPGYRIRAVNMHHTLQELNFSSTNLDGPQQFKNFDCIIFFKAFTLVEHQSMLYAKALGKRVVFDVFEDLIDQPNNYPQYIPMLRLADLVICCSTALAERIKPYNPQVEVVEDAVEVFLPKAELSYRDVPKLRVGWIGMQENAHHAEALRPLIEECGYQLICIHNGPNADIPWELSIWSEHLLTCDIAIAPLDISLQPSKSNNKISTYMALGLPVIASPLQAYLEVIKPGINGFIANTIAEWRSCLVSLGNLNLRQTIGIAGYHTVMRFRKKNIALKLAKILAPVQYDQLATDLIIPTIYNPDHLATTVASIIACTQVPYHIVVINNGKNSKQLPKQVKVIETIGLNYAASLNLGIKSTTGKYIGMLNDDIIVTDGWLAPLINAIQQGAAIVNPMSTCGNGVWYAENLLLENISFGPSRNELKQEMIGEKSSEKPGFYKELLYTYSPTRTQEMVQFKWLALYCTLISRDTFNTIGWLDEQFGHGHEDVDYGFRADKLGLRSVVNKQSFIFHFGGTSTDKKKLLEPDFPGKAERLFADKYKAPLLVIYAGLSFEKWNGSATETTGIGGSETAAIRMAESFTKIGFKVVVCCECLGMEELINGVQYLDVSRFESFIGIHVIDIFILSRYIYLLELPIRAVKTYFWSHDICAKGTELGANDLVKKHLNKLDGIFCLSTWHRDIFMHYHQIGPEKIKLTGNGIDLSKFKPQVPITKIPNKFIYTSSPDRGLLTLLTLFPKIKKIFPDASLDIYYGFETWDKSIQQSGDTAQLTLRNRTYDLMKQEGVVYHGRVSQTRLAQAFLESDVWLYPTTFIETFCITALEAQVAETLCICSDLSALRSTVGERGLLIQHDPSHPNYDDHVLEMLHGIQHNTARKQELLKSAKTWALQQTWDHIANQWNDIFNTTEHN